MRRLIMLSLAALFAASCSTPVLRSDLMKEGIRDASMAQVAQNPSGYQGKIFILGGIVVSTKLTEAGPLMEAMYVPVDSNGDLKVTKATRSRFLAFYAQDSGVLDPAVYRTGKRVTLAGRFVEVRPGYIGEVEYAFPCFEIRQIYLWEEGREYRSGLAPFFSIGIGIGSTW